MASVFQPPPTWALPILVDEATQKAIFNPIWLKWFVDLTSSLTGTGGGAGTGDVIGPAGATNGALALYDGTTGKLLKAAASLGTTVKVLHGNASGVPTFSPVDLSSDVTGNLVGGQRSLSTNYISGTGTAGVDNTAQTVVTVAIAANTLTQVGDQLQLLSYWRGDTGAAITGTLALNGGTVGNTTDAGGTALQLCETWLQYVDATHANVLEYEAGALGAVSAANVAGFNWAASQNLTLAQNAIVANHIVVFSLTAEALFK
jgi:hypothetical protein